MSEYKLRIGNAVLSLLFENDRESRAIGRYFGRPSSAEEADIRLSIRFRDDAARGTAVPSSLFLSKTGDGNGFSLAGGLVHGRFSPASGEGELEVQRLITKGGYARIYEQVFYQAYWSAIRRKEANSFLLHSCGVIRGGRGYAFTGKSGSGKSTIAGLSSGSIVLNDEITVIDLSGPRPVIRDTPFNGYFTKKTEGSADLAGIMLLEQAPLHRLTRTDDIERIKTLARELIPPMGLESAFSPAVYMEMFDCAKKASDAVPLYILEFLPNPGFWKQIAE